MASDNGPEGLGAGGRFPTSPGARGSYALISTTSFSLVSWKSVRGAVAESPVVAGPLAAGPARMGPQRLLLSAALFWAQMVPQEASQHCGRLEYWNPDNLCCGSCLQRFGPPPCPGEEQELGIYVRICMHIFLLSKAGIGNQRRTEVWEPRFGVELVGLKHVRGMGAEPVKMGYVRATAKVL